MELTAASAVSVDLIRLSPQADNMPALLAAYRALLDDGTATMQAVMPSGDYCNGFWQRTSGT